MAGRRTRWRHVSQLLLVLTVLAAGVGTRGPATPEPVPAAAQAQGGRWVLEGFDRDPSPANPDGPSVTHTPGKVVKRTGDGWPVAEFTATYAVPPPTLTPGTTHRIEVKVVGRLTSTDVRGEVGLSVIQLVNGRWNRVGVETAGGCQPDPFPLGPLACRQPAPVSGTFDYAVPTSGTTYSIGVAVLNEQAAINWRYRFEATPITTTTRTTSTTASTSTTTSTTTTTLPPGKRPPVILLPGVAGSELYVPGVPGDPQKPDAQVWPLRTYAWADRTAMEMLLDGAPTGDIRTGSILMGAVADFYGGMVRYLRDVHGYQVSRDLATFPYDWRLSNEQHFGALDRVVNDMRVKSGRDKVVLLAHSMGGLIARGYVLSSPTRAAKVDAVITMGTPFWGSPKVFYALVAGYTFGNLSVGASTMKALVQNFPAAYQLLPHDPFVWDDRQARYLTIDESMEIEYERILASSGEVSGVQRPNVGLLEVARRFHAAGGTRAQPTPMPAGVELYTIVGVGVRTLDEFSVRAPRGREKGILLGGEDVALEPLFGDGDGTVPLANLEIANATARYYLPWSEDDPTAHGNLANSSRVQAIVGSIVTGAPPSSGAHPYPFVRADDRYDPEPGVDLTLHSDAHLQVSANGRTLGGADGTITETLPGTFLQLNGVEYAALPDRGDDAYDVRITGVAEGFFELSVRHVTARSTTWVDYPMVLVDPGTTASMTLRRATLASAAPTLQVRSDGTTSSVTPLVRTAEAGADGSGGGVAVIVAVVLALAVLAVAAVLVARRRARGAAAS